MPSPQSSTLGALAVALTLVAGGAQAASLPRAPYLQNVSPTSALVAFRTGAACSTAQVRYAEQGQAFLEKPSSATGTRHAVVLEGLSPATEYTYVVEACGAQSAPKRLRTAPAPGTRRVHFAAVGDFGVNNADQKGVAASMLSRRPELFLALGDNAYESGTEAEFQNNMFAPMAGLLSEVPVFASLGNHEYGTPDAKPYIDNFYLPSNNPAGSERFYSFDWGHVHFVALDSTCALGALTSRPECSMAAQKAWLEKDLAQSKAAWKVVYFHHPPWSSGSHGSNLKMRSHFAPIFEKHGVDLVLTGHDHNYERTHPVKGDARAADGITYLVVGNGGRTLRSLGTSQPAWSAKRSNSGYGYLDVQVEEGTLTGRLIGVNGQAEDTFTLTKQLPPVQHQLSVEVEGERGVAPHTALLRASTSLSGATVRWDFGDGTSGEGAQVSHVYAQPGEYTVKATATSGGTTLSSTSQVSVAAASTGGVISHLSVAST
jgi:chitodextrinase